MRPAVALLLVFLSSNPLRLDVLPRVALAPAAIRVRAWVDRHPDNRLLQLAVDNHTTYYRATATELEGEQSRVVHEWFFDGLPCGHYAVTTYLFRVAQGRVATFIRSLSVEITGCAP